MKIYHQLGFRPNWNLESSKEDGVGNGFILSPRHMAKDEITKRFPSTLRENVIFDPQFFYPVYAKGQLDDYDFHPAIASSATGFQTEEYIHMKSEECALKCLTFQRDFGFEYAIIPTRFTDGMPSDYIDNVAKFSLDPFLKAASRMDLSMPLMLQLVVNDQMISDQDYRDNILNWVTGIPEISGVYVIGQVKRPYKQITNVKYLEGLLWFVDSLVSNELTTIVGYLGADALIVSLAQPTTVTIGTYFKTQIFNLTDFQEDDQQEGGGGYVPARIYAPGLVQCIEKNYVESIITLIPNSRDSIFNVTKHAADVFTPFPNWHWTMPTVYKHNLLAISGQLQQLAKFEGRERYIYLDEILSTAIANFESIIQNVAIDEENSGKHIYLWRNVIKKYARDKGWI